MNGTHNSVDHAHGRGDCDVKQEIAILEEDSPDTWYEALQCLSHQISFIEDGLIGTVWYDAIEVFISEPEYDLFFTPDMFAAPPAIAVLDWHECREIGDPIHWFDCQEPQDLRFQ